MFCQLTGGALFVQRRLLLRSLRGFLRGVQAVKLLTVRFHFAQYARARIALRLPFRARFTQRFGSVFGFHRQTQWRTQRRQPLALRGGVTGEALAFARQMRAFLT